jgi:hypothetical protein
VQVRRGTFGNVADTHIHNLNVNKNYGNVTPMHVGTSYPGERRSLVKFDLSFLPPGAVITLAEMFLAQKNGNPGMVDLHRMNAAWGELTATWANTSTAFNPVVEKSFLNGATWTTPWSRVRLDALIQAYANGTYVNNGWMLKQALTTNTEFQTSEHSNIPTRPRLYVCYTVPFNGPAPFTTFDGYNWYKVPVAGTMTDDNIRAACEAMGLSVPCQASGACFFNDPYCMPQTAENSCGDPMLALSTALCAKGPSQCAALNNVFTYMGNKWQGGCGAGAGWCIPGNTQQNKLALCVN